MTDGGGYAAARLMPVNRAGTVTATVSAPAHPEAEALTFTCSARLPRVDLFRVDWGPTHVPINEDCGGGRTTSGPGPMMWPARPGEACSKVLGIQVTDLVEDGQIPVEGVEVRPVALDASGNPAAGLAEFLPSRGRTDAAGRACFATVLAPGVDLPELRIRFELPAIDAGDGTPLGCAWRLPVSGEPWLTKVIGGQSQVALPGRSVPGAVVFTGGETYLTTTQPGDALSLEHGNPVSNVIHPDGSQTLTFSTQEDIARVRIQLGDAPLPRVLGLSNETYTTTVAIGPPEVEFLAHAEDAWKPVSALPVVSDEDVTGTGVVPDDARFRVRVKAPVGTGSLGPAVLRARNTVGDAIDAGGLLPANNAEIALAPAGVTDRCQLFESAALIALPEPVWWLTPDETGVAAAAEGEMMEDPPGDSIPPEPFPVSPDVLLVGSQCSVEANVEGTHVVGEAEIMCEILSRPDWYWMDDKKRPVNTDVNVCQGQPAAIQVEIHPPKDYQWQNPARVEMQVVPGERAGTMEDLSSGTRYSPPLPYRINAHEVGQTIFSLNYHALLFDERFRAANINQPICR